MTDNTQVLMQIRGGVDAILTVADNHGFRIQLGHDGIVGTVSLDYGEARELMLAIYEAIYENQFVPANDLYAGRHERRA